MGFVDVEGSFPGVGVLAGDEDDVAEVAFGEVGGGIDAVVGPGEEGFGAHVVIDQGSSVAGFGVVGEGAVEEVAVEEDGGAGFDFDGDGLVVGVGEALGFEGAVEAGVGVPGLVVEDAGFVGAGDDPEAAVFDGGVVEGDPGSGEGAVAGGDVDFVLVPGLAGFAAGFDEEHGLHAFHVRADESGEGLDEGWVGEELFGGGADFVGEVDAEDFFHHFVIGFGWVGGGVTLDCAIVAPTDRDGLLADGFDFGRGEGVLDDEVAVFLEEGGGLGGEGQVDEAGRGAGVPGAEW